MKIFRQLIETEGAGFYLADATHDGETIQSLVVYPVSNDTVQDVLGHTMHDLTDLTAEMQKLLTESLKE